MSSDSESDVNIKQVSDAEEIAEESETASSSDMEGRVSSRLRPRKNRNAQDPIVFCMKIMLPDHLAMFMEERELDRDIEPIQCSTDIIEKVFGNYLIVKTILGQLRWQDKLICKDVCPLWNNVVNILQVEQNYPVDFTTSTGLQTMKNGVTILKSSEFHTEPIVVFTFCSAMAYYAASVACQVVVPSPCSPPCEDEHDILDIIHQMTTAPNDCMFTVKSTNSSYMPLPHSPTMKSAMKKHSSVYGLYIPKIPGVEFKIININCSSGIQLGVMPEIKKLTEKYIVKGVVACLTENYLLYVEENNEECLAFLNEMQPDIPFAFGGCLVEDTATNDQDLVSIVDSVNKGKEFVSGNILSLGLFVVPKEDSSTTVKEPRHSFEAYSFVLKSSVWNKSKIMEAIQEFSESVPRFEHSIALKFSCVGRQRKHEVEQNAFRLYFPRTRIAGCFGNGELGVNHPRQESKPANTKQPNKRSKEFLAYEKVHSYSTVFFYIGWGKIIEKAERAD